MARALTRRARDDASHRPGRVGLSRKRERPSKLADDPRELRYSGLMSAAFTIRHHFSISVFWKAASAVGVC